MQNYRLALIINSGLKKEEKEKLLKTITSLLDVKDIKSESLGEKKLAYPIQNELKGEYYLLQFAAKTIASDFQKRVYNQAGVLRHLLVKN